MFRIELLVDARNELREGALWDVQEEVLLLDRQSRWHHPSHRCTRIRSASLGTARAYRLMCLRAGGAAVVALRDGLHCFDFETGSLTPIADPERDNRRTRMNDGKVDRQGRFLVGSMDYEEREPLGALAL